jgi:outer membrane protein assembly factor BamB
MTGQSKKPERLRKALRVTAIVGAIAAAQLAVGAAVLYYSGLRIVFTGGGRARLAFVEDAETQAETIRRHREAQRAALEAAAPAAATIAPATAPAPDTETAAPASDADAGAADAPAALDAEPPAVPGEAPAWAEFRGRARDGHYRERPIRTDWPAGGFEPIWRQPAGGGYASFAIAGGRAFTIEQRGQNEVVAAYDVASGRELWTHEWRALFREMMGGDGPRATPTWAGGRVYALGATGELRALDDRTGALAWRVNILEDNGARNLDWGMAASPLIIGDSVVVLPGGRNGRSVVAYDRTTGARRWSALDDKAAYAAPMLATLAAEPQLLVFTASRLVSLAADGSRVLWEFPWRTPNDINAAQPLVIGDSRVFISSSYGTGAAVVEVTRTADGRFQAREVWRNIRMKNRFTSSVLHEGFIYGLDENILACVDAATGDLRWKGGRYGYGQVLLASGHLVVLTEDGDLVLVRATPERHEEVARSAALEGKTWNHPAVTDGILLVRNLREMAAFDLRAGSP